MADYPPITSGLVRLYAIGFIACSTRPEQELDELTRICCEGPSDSPLFDVLIDDGSSPELPRLKTRSYPKRLASNGRRVAYELHAMVPEGKTAEETFQQISAVLAKHGWECNGGPA